MLPSYIACLHDFILVKTFQMTFNESWKAPKIVTSYDNYTTNRVTEEVHEMKHDQSILQVSQGR